MLNKHYSTYIEIKRFHTYKSFTVLSWQKKTLSKKSSDFSLSILATSQRLLPFAKVRPDQRSGVTSATMWNYSGWFVSTCRPCRLMRGWWHPRIQTSEDPYWRIRARGRSSWLWRIASLWRRAFLGSGNVVVESCGDSEEDDPFEDEVSGYTLVCMAQSDWNCNNCMTFEAIKRKKSSIFFCSELSTWSHDGFQVKSLRSDPFGHVPVWVARR